MLSCRERRKFMAANKPNLPEFNPPRLCMRGPGPSPVDERVMRAMAAPVLGHLDPRFLRLMDDIQTLLRYVFETEKRLTIPVSGTGSAGMEATVANLLEAGDEIVVCVNGYFGERMCDMVSRLGAKPCARRSGGGAQEGYQKGARGREGLGRERAFPRPGRDLARRAPAARA